MWSRHLLRPIRPAGGHRKAFFARSYNGQPQGGPHTTYFQPPPEAPKPPRRIFRSILLGTTCIGLGMYAHSWLLDMPFLGVEMDEMESPEGQQMVNVMWAAAQDGSARNVPMMDMDLAQETLELRASFSVTSKAVGHACQLPSNLPCEDAEHAGVYTILNDPGKDWATWTIFDGHAGPRTAQILKEYLPLVVGDHLAENGCVGRRYTPNDSHIVNAIKAAFKHTDDEIMQKAVERTKSTDGDLAHTIAALAPALSGSCALMALFDPAQSILRIANVGDSRAVLGRWDSFAGKYKAQPMSVDQTGFNEEEVERLQREHPGEESVDPKTGRVHGIAVARAFGDSRWKWPQELSQLVHDKFWGPKPRPSGMIQTPPYLTAEPEIAECRVQTGQHADFLIMASDGLWDLMSSEDAVVCVEQWLKKFKATNFLEKRPTVTTLAELFRQKDEEANKPTYTHLNDMGEDEDTYFDENEGITKWRVSPKHFVVEDEHCGVHLIKNALGGKRRNLYRGIMSVQPPLSRDVRDDITVHVIFFGDFQQHIVN